FLFLLCAGTQAKEYTVKSPDGRLVLTVDAAADIKWSLSHDGTLLLKSSRIGLELRSGKILGENEKISKADAGKLSEVIKPVVAHKRSEINANCNTLVLTFKSGFSLNFRVYNDGAAYRFETGMKEDLTIRNEIAELEFPSGSFSWYPVEESFFSHNERTFIHSSVDTLNRQLASLPTLFQIGGKNVLITESDIDDYPGMWLTGKGSGKFSGSWAKYPDTEVLRNDRDFEVTGTKGYIAQTKGTRTFPWRVFIVSQNDAGLVESDLVDKLAKPSMISETGWIKPGQVSWDWWNANNIYGVDFRAGINNDTYKHYIDFAAENGIEYIILDEGWYKLGNVLQEVNGINVQELCSYGEKKNVGVILWVVWKSLWDKIDEALTLYDKWGVKGLKIDFMQRDDQKIVNFYHEVARKAAEHHMLVDFHSAYKPDGMGLTWPNVITREGVKGMEWDKWSRETNPEHDVTIPFTRMVAGPMDYTPGAMINMDKANFTPMMTRPASQGPRAHQVAMYVIYESPLQMLSDSPSNYRKEKETTDFITSIPVVWDDVVGVDGKVGDYIVVARRSGKEWFVGAMTDWTARSINIDLSFIPEGKYEMEIFQDGINADRYASDYKHYKMIKVGKTIKVQLAPGGGWAARIVPVE
ncbi:MAG TPA: glycoside hydrolase family 97 protein, partial [Bacteroidales bacterium]|nr:glycoside hydrolase family 97 protein [Bacteroidales bacterium]